MHDPLISIAIPVRDAGARLQRTLESIAASTGIDPARVEVVIVDDGSTDGAVEAARSARYPFALSVHRGEWGSQSTATNVAIAHCRGRYVLLSAQDIRFEPEMLRVHLDAHERFGHDGLGVAVLGELPYAPEADTTPFTFYLVNGGFQFAYFLIQDPHHVPPNFLYAPNVSLRREALEHVGGFDEAFPYGLQDTDLGIRLATAGVRLVHEPLAIGLHDHPTTLDAFRRRMARIGPLRLVLEEKHPYHEPSIPSWDLVIASCLAYDEQRLELDLTSIERLEPVVNARAGFRELWRKQLVKRLHADSANDDQRQTLALTGRLFHAYGRVLQASWSGAYLDAAVERHGREQVDVILQARLARLQAPRPAYRIIEAQLRRRGLSPARLAPAHCRSARVVHGIADRSAALAVLDRFIPPSAGAVDQELVLLLSPGMLDAAARSELERAAIVIEADVPAGLAVVGDTVDTELLIVTDAASIIDESRTVELAERVLARFPRVAVLGGGMIEDDGTLRYGAAAGERGPEPLVASQAEPRGATPLEIPIGECLVLRREAVVALGRTVPGSDEEPWPVRLARAVRESGLLMLHLPDLVARRDRWMMTSESVATSADPERCSVY